MRKKVMRILSLCMVASMTLTPIQSVYAAEMTSVIKINEVESNEPTTDIDWVEIINTGTEAVDLSNWFITDNKDLERLAENEEWRIAEGTVLNPGEVLVIEHSDILDNLSLEKKIQLSFMTITTSSRIHFHIVVMQWEHIREFQMEQENLSTRQLQKELLIL